jgi:hypothetical protein
MEASIRPLTNSTEAQNEIRNSALTDRAGLDHTEPKFQDDRVSEKLVRPN